MGKYVYPIPMYIPLVEGRHACDGDSSVPTWDASGRTAINNNVANGATQHPDCLKTNAKGYTMRLHTWHIMYRSHSTFASSGLLTELYKQDKGGKLTFTDSNRGQDKISGPNGAIYDENIYEPVLLSQADATKISLPRRGALVHIYNDRGAIRVYATVSPLVQPGEIMIGQGSWMQLEDTTTTINGKQYYVDRGGNANTLIDIRPSRICQGMSLANDCKVAIALA
jgi:anaerobic dimethyl sulfoxide reductase subunit A